MEEKIQFESDCTYHDRDGKKYPAKVYHLQTVGDYEGPRVYCLSEKDTYGKPTLKQIMFKESGAEGIIWRDASVTSASQTGWKQGGLEESKYKGLWYRCIFVRPQAGFHDAGSQTGGSEVNLVRVPVVDLMVDVSRQNGRPIVNHVGNVRHIGDAIHGPAQSRVPYYVEK